MPAFLHGFWAIFVVFKQKRCLSEVEDTAKNGCKTGSFVFSLVLKEIIDLRGLHPFFIIGRNDFDFLFHPCLTAGRL
ncbi:MAG TPA: hypothetical protein PKW80_06615 [Bacteroidales bacterium]|nr:hypothetical protein [Bacteroidales bacterium]